MKLHSFLPVMCAVLVFSAMPQLNVIAETVVSEADVSAVHTVQLLDFDGNIFATQEVKDGEYINADEIETDNLYKRVDEYTEMKFSSWDAAIDSPIVEDTAIQALYVEASISCAALPTKTVYGFRSGSIDLTGLSVIITMKTQLPEFDEDGTRLMSTEVYDITPICTTNYTGAAAAFADSDTALIEIYPPNSIAIASYTITLEIQFLRGDIDYNGTVDSVDASEALSYYAIIQSGGEAPNFSEDKIDRADVNQDGVVDAIDASAILSYYAIVSTGGEADWDAINGVAVMG